MRTFLAVFLVLTVSGDDENIRGVLEDSVLLPCNCTERNLDKEFKWQMEEPSKMLVLQHNKTFSNFFGRFKGQAKIFLSENSDNCSVLISNITANDQGKYRCKFSSQGVYKKFFVNLNIFAQYNVCQKNSTSILNGNLGVKVFQCDAWGRYRKAEIQWSLEGQLLTNSPTTHINHTNTADAPTGLYHFTSELTTKLNWTSEPTCHVKAKGISTIVSHDCGPRNDKSQAEVFTRYRYFKIIPFVLVLGFSLVIWRRQELSKSLPKV